MDEQAFAKDVNFVRAMIHYQIDLALFGIEEARRNVLARDPQAQSAMSFFPEAEKLMALARTKTTSAKPR
jgi:hypothetical protein